MGIYDMEPSKFIGISSDAQHLVQSFQIYVAEARVIMTGHFADKIMSFYRQRWLRVKPVFTEYILIIRARLPGE